jgi:hypothetical protein
MTQPKSFQVNTSNPIEHQKALEIQELVNRGLEYLNQKHGDRAVLAFKQARERCTPKTQVFDIVTHNLLIAYRMAVADILKTNDHTPVNRYLPEITALQLTSEMVKDTEFRGKFADTFKNIGMDLHFARQHEPSLFFFRKAISIQSCPSYYVDLTNALAWTRKPALLSDFTNEYQTNELGKHIFIACSPKSGSTFLKNLVVNVTGFKDLFSVYAGLQNEHELDLPQFVKFGKENTVTQQHSRATEANIQMMQAFGIKPVILVRNIFDTVMSLLDFYTKGFTFSTFFNREEFLNFPTEEKIDLLIEYTIPWYFQFVSGWQRAEKEGRLNVTWLTYEEMIADKPAAVEKVLKTYGLTANIENIRYLIDAIESDGEKNRFNKGIAGRGKIGLNDAQKEKVKKLARFFPSNDFSVIGL